MFERPIDGQEEFQVYRYKMPAGRWTAKHAWRLGLAGPTRRGLDPYSVLPGGFSRVAEIDGEVKRAEFVDWYGAMLRQKGMLK